jgi:D-aminopeptidase
VLSDGHVVGVVLLTNFGSWDRLTVDGVAVGRALGPPAHVAPPPAGSCLGVVVTDAPLDHSACERLARRVGLGLARTGSTATHGSGEIFLAAALGLRAPRGSAASATPLAGRELNEYFEAVVDASEEAVLASMLAAHEVTGREGRTIPALPLDAVRRILAEGRHR